VVSGFDAILPPTPRQVKAILAARPGTTAVVISGPSYEGISMDNCHGRSGDRTNIVAISADAGAPRPRPLHRPPGRLGSW
jgi:hypothetical protein